uniref:Peptidase M12B propeptide domain-containing protein n=1 Tax=Malurus cyaneus samueli TaxID=2593467 RepID=A0A8C5X4T6_9PASS
KRSQHDHQKCYIIRMATICLTKVQNLNSNQKNEPKLCLHFLLPCQLRSFPRVFPSPEEFLSSLDHYEIAFPIQVDQNGDFLTFDVRRQLKRRPRRSLPYEKEQQVFYKVSAHRTQFLLNLTLHSKLLAEHFTVEYWKRDGMDWQHDFHEDCHYAGHLQDRYLSSKVAISNCNGLVSLGVF